MSYEHIRRLNSVAEEYQAARMAVEYLEADWLRLHSHPSFTSLSLAQLKRSSAGLETTYLVRLFSVFEAILRDYLPRRFPARPDRRTVYELINKVASVHRISVPVRDGAQTARAFLNTFLAWLP